MRGGWDMMSSTCVSSPSGGIHSRSLVAGAGVVGTAYGTHHSGAQIMEARSPAPAWHMHHNIAANTVKQEPMDHDSSAYGSGSDGFHSSSPNSSDHNSRDSNPPPIPYTATSAHIDIPISHYYNTPVTNRNIPVMAYQQSTVHGFNPLTPPSFEPMVSPKIQVNTVENQAETPELETDRVPTYTKVDNTTLTPCTTPPNEVTPPKSPKHNSEEDCDSSYYDGKPEDHLRRLQMAFERNGMLPESPKGSETRDSADEDEDMDEVDEQGLRIPRVNSHGKVKTFKCKQCEFVAVTKLDFWEHSRGHIKAEKLLTCPKCPFVTEYKHHLEYHLRNHFGSKPFKCDKCSYSCVNKSMLNSHLKSHSNIYQYRCSDCTYATKYCHSLKLHLRKYKHSPAMVLNPDGTPNPLPIIDVYGTRRGPKSKSGAEKEITSPPPQNPQTSPNLQQHSIFPHFMLPNSQQSPMPLPFPYGPLLGAFPGALGTPFTFPHMNTEQLSPRSNDRSTPESLKIDEDVESIKDEEAQEEEEEDDDEPPKEALDLSKPEITLPIIMPKMPTQPEQTPMTTHTPQVPINMGKNRRKGRAFKLERIQQGSSSDEEQAEEKLDKVVEPEVVVKVIEPSIKKAEIFNCQYCDIAFRDVVMYTMHMGYHGYKDPFTCNMCGEQSSDKVSFFLHIARTSHS